MILDQFQISFSCEKFERILSSYFWE